MATSSRDRWLAIVYATTIFASAFLLFQVQPVVSKRILPWFGGSPAVWTACMLFFQALLFAGYAYAHASQRWLRPGRQAIVHLVLVVAAMVTLRVLPDASWQPREGGDPVWQILLILAATVGLPYFVLSATAPLLQAWYARSFPGRVPYRLYALSNFASLAALLSYPFVFERALDLPQQASFWWWGYFFFAVLCGALAAWLWQMGAQSHAARDPDSPQRYSTDDSKSSEDTPTWGQRLIWLLLPALGTITLLATTNHVCADVAVMPFLWVVPLALYLLTFIIAFDHPRWYRRVPTAALTLVAIYGASMVGSLGLGQVEVYALGTTGRFLRATREAYIAWQAGAPMQVSHESPEFHVGFAAFLVLNFAAMFGICLLCHGELVRRRPHPRYLTSFYLMIAAGGVLGGVAVSIVAPNVFRTYAEWRLVMFGGCVVTLTVILHHLIQSAFPGDLSVARRRGSVVVPLVALCVLLVPASLVIIDMVEYLAVSQRGVLLRTRNFYGALTVQERNAEDPKTRSLVLLHGSTAHGSQFTDPARRIQPTTYYSTIGGVGRTLNFYHRPPRSGGLRMGCVGLGTGSMAAYVGPEDLISFYEINPAVMEIAESGNWFTYLHDCRQRGGDYEIKPGDARLTLERELATGNPQRFDVIVLDAFSGDSIPVHLMTEEAFALYLKHLATAKDDGEDGALAVHISNRYLDLEPLVRGVAERFGLGYVSVRNTRNTEQFIYNAEWVILTRNAQLLAELKPFAGPPSEGSRPPILWTDDRSNLFDVLK